MGDDADTPRRIGPESLAGRVMQAQPAVSLAQISSLADVMRAKGIAKYRGMLGEAHIEMELGPERDTATGAVKPEADPDLCRCGHASYQHVNGLCAVGCEPGMCLDPEKKT